jgi:hypothetical protein
MDGKDEDNVAAASWSKVAWVWASLSSLTEKTIMASAVVQPMGLNPNLCNIWRFRRSYGC